MHQPSQLQNFISKSKFIVEQLAVSALPIIIPAGIQINHDSLSETQSNSTMQIYYQIVSGKKKCKTRS